METVFLGAFVACHLAVFFGRLPSMETEIDDNLPSILVRC
jgi:hypothetical protein